MSYNNGLTPDDVYLTAYRRDEDGSVVVHVETPLLAENSAGPMLTIYLNDDLEDPLWDNRIEQGEPTEWQCPGCHAIVEPSLVRRHRDECKDAP